MAIRPDEGGTGIPQLLAWSQGKRWNVGRCNREEGGDKERWIKESKEDRQIRQKCETEENNNIRLV